MLRRGRTDDRSSIAQGDEVTFQIHRKLKPPGRVLSFMPWSAVAATSAPSCSMRSYSGTRGPHSGNLGAFRSLSVLADERTTEVKPVIFKSFPGRSGGI